MDGKSVVNQPRRIKKIPEVRQTKTSCKRILNSNPLLKLAFDATGCSTKPLNQSLSNTINDVLNTTSKNIAKDIENALNNKSVYKLPTTASKSKCTSTNSFGGGRKIPPKNPTGAITANKSVNAKPQIKPIPTKFVSNFAINKFNKNPAIVSSRFPNGTLSKPSSSAKSIITDSSKSHIYKNQVIKPKVSVQVNGHTKPNMLKSGTTKTNKPLRRSLSAQFREQKKIKNTAPEKHSSAASTEILRRRSLSAQFFEQKQSNKNFLDIPKNQSKAFSSSEDLRVGDRKILAPLDMSDVPEANESMIHFKTPLAYARRSLAPKLTPLNQRKLFLYQPVGKSGPSLKDIEKWLLAKGKTLDSYHHLKCFGIYCGKATTVVDEENKENVEELAAGFDKSSYENLEIPRVENHEEVPVAITEENLEKVAKEALGDLNKLVIENYPLEQCESWLAAIREKYRKLDTEPEYWECRAAIEQARGNTIGAMECYRTAIVQGAEIKHIDESLEQLLQKFSLLNIASNSPSNQPTTPGKKSQTVMIPINVFKSSIIQFAVQEMKNKMQAQDLQNDRKIVATPVRRSTRLSRSRSRYTSTPGVQICSSLQELDSPTRKSLQFKKNNALI